MKAIRLSFFLCAAGLAASQNAAADGLSPGWHGAADDGLVSWSQLRARVGLTVGTPGAAAWSGAGARIQSMQMLGDYFFFSQDPDAGDASGLRATSGWLSGPASNGLVLPGRATGTLAVTRGLASPPLLQDAAGDASGAGSPYLGLGYSTGLWRSGFSLSADVGLVSRSAGAVRLGRPLVANASLEDLFRAPVMQLGLSYAF